MDRWLFWAAIALVGIAGPSFVGQSAWGDITVTNNISGKVSVKEGDTWVESPSGQSSDQETRYGLPAGRIGLIVLLGAALAAAAAVARRKRMQSERKREMDTEDT